MISTCFIHSFYQFFPKHQGLEHIQCFLIIIFSYLYTFVSMIDDKQFRSELELIVGENKYSRQRKRWQLQQTIKYCEFVKKNRSTLEQTQKKQKQRIYNKMSEYIGTRSTHQCRSHHQKVLKRYQSIQGFIKNFAYKINSARNFMEWSQTELEGIQCLRKLEKKKNEQQLQLRKILKSELPQNQFQFHRKFNTNQVPAFQLQSHFSSLNPCKFQYSSDQLPQSIHFGKYSKEHPLIHNKSIENEGIFIGRSQNRHLQKQNSNFYVSPQAKKTGKGNKNNNLISKVDLKTQSILYQTGNLNFPNDFGFPHHAWKMKKLHGQRYENYQIPNSKPYSQGYSQPERRNFFWPHTTHNKNRNVLLPTYECLKQKPQQRINNAAQICTSIMHKRNLNVINLLVKDNKIELTADTIKINGKEDKNQNYKCWIECVKIEELSEADQESESESEEIQREMVEEILGNVLVKFGIISPQLVNQFSQRPYFNYSPQFEGYFDGHSYPSNVPQPYEKFQKSQHPYFDSKRFLPYDLIEQQIDEGSSSSLIENLAQIQDPSKNRILTNPYEHSEKIVQDKKSAYHEYLRLLEQKTRKSAESQSFNNPVNTIPIIDQEGCSNAAIILSEPQGNTYKHQPEFRFPPLVFNSSLYQFGTQIRNSLPDSQLQIPNPKQINKNPSLPDCRFDDFTKMDLKKYDGPTEDGNKQKQWAT